MTEKQKRNKELCERFPFLLPKNVWTGKLSEDYDYTYIRGIGEIPKGWEKLFLQMCEDIRQPLIDAGYLDEFMFTQIKEKYNTLRAYNNGAPKVVHEIIDKYSIMSSYVCTRCGKPATCESQGWIESFCDDCWKGVIKPAYVEKIKFKPYYRVEGFENGKRYKKKISFKNEWKRYLDSIKN